MTPTTIVLPILLIVSAILCYAAAAVAPIRQARGIEGPPTDPTDDGWYANCTADKGKDPASMTWTLPTCNLTGNLCQELCSW